MQKQEQQNLLHYQKKKKPTKRYHLLEEPFQKLGGGQEAPELGILLSDCQGTPLIRER